MSLLCDWQVAGSLPAGNRILLQTGAPGTAKVQQAVATALAAQLGASLLVCYFVFVRPVQLDCWASSCL